MQLEPDVAKSQAHWWYDPKYIINDLNVNVRHALDFCCEAGRR